MRALIGFAAVLFVVLAPGVSAAQNADLSASDLIEAVNGVRAFKAPDAFTPTPSQDGLIGRRFTVNLPYKQEGFGGLSSRLGGWSYDPNTQSLTLRIEKHLWLASLFGNPAGDAAAFHGFYIDFAQHESGSFVGSNAYGATRTVTQFQSRGVALASDDADPWMQSYEPMKVVSSVPPEVARAVADHLYVVITGELKAAGNGKVVSCGIDGFGATIDTPVSESEHICLINAHIENVSVFGSVAGTTKLVAKWPS